MKKKLTILLFLLLLIFLSSYIWWIQAIKPVNPLDNKNVSFTVESGEPARDIAEKLQKQGLIRSALAFFIMARFGGLSMDIQAGNFMINPKMSLPEIAASLQHGTIDITITIPEGWRKEEIALKIAQEFSIPESEFIKSTKEGYLFPDTYRIPKDATLDSLTKIFTDNFNKKIQTLNANKIKNSKLTIDDIINIASLVEREAKLEEDRPLIAGVILNRLNLGMKLDIDATIQYALGYQPQQKTWWKKDLSLEDIGIDSPYNTYSVNGLPPTPICNPGLSAIKAVIDHPKTNYLYYVADSKGKSHFAETIEGHNANISKFLNK